MPQSHDLLSKLTVAEAYLRTQIALQMYFSDVLEIDAKAQVRARQLLDGLGLPDLFDHRAQRAPAAAASITDPPASPRVATPAPAPARFGTPAAVPERFVTPSFGDTPGRAPDRFGTPAAAMSRQAEPVVFATEPAASPPMGKLSEHDYDEPTEAITEHEEPEELSFEDIDFDFEELELETDGELDEEPTRPAIASPFPDDFREDDADLFSTRPAPVEPLPEFEGFDDEDPATLGDPDETEDLLRDASMPSPPPSFLTDDDTLSEPDFVEMEIEEPGEDALVTIEDTSDARSDLNNLARFSDSDMDVDDDDTGSSEVIIRTNDLDDLPELDAFDLVADSDLSPDDEETFVADLADIEKMKAKMMGDDERPTLATPRAAVAPVVAGVAGVSARPGVAGVSARPASASASASASVTPGLYGNPSVPQIRDRNAPKPRAAAIQIDAAQEEAAKGGSSGPLLEEEEVLALGSSEDYGEEEEIGGGNGLSIDVQEYEDFDDLELEEVEVEEIEEVEPLPPLDAPADPSMIKALMKQAAAAVEDGRMEDAIDLYSDAIDHAPDNIDVYVLRGRLYLDYQDYSRAMSDFMLAEEIDASNPEPQIAVGDLFFARKDYTRAIEHFDEALRMDPNHAMAFCRRGISHFHRKNYDEAVSDLVRAEKLDNDIPNIKTYIAMAKKKKR